MLDAARIAIRLCGESPLDRLRDDEAVRFATLKLLEIVGEASKAVSPETRADLEAIPWRAIARTRDRLSHGYFDIDLATVAHAVRDRLPGIARDLERALRSD